MGTDTRGAAVTFSRPTTKKRGGRPRGSIAAHTAAIRDAVLSLQDEYDEMTVRGVFYALEVRGVIPKTQAAYRQVQRQVLLLRREGWLPWEFIADGTRWVHAPETWDSVEDAVRELARTYRRNLWRSQGRRLEFWLEKDALAGIASKVTYPWGVRLMVSRGQSSDTYCFHAAQEVRRAWDEAGVLTYVYTLYDSDESGRDAADKVAEKLDRYSDGTPFEFTVLAVTDEQIENWRLPTRPAKEKGAAPAVELDAIAPDVFKALIEDTITSHVDPDAWKLEQAYETNEREVFTRLVEAAA